MARKPRTGTAGETENLGEATVESRIARLEAEVEEINLSGSVQAKDVQTLRARLEQLKSELDEISEGASAEDLARVEGQLATLDTRLGTVETRLTTVESATAGLGSMEGRIDANVDRLNVLSARVDELSKGAAVAETLAQLKTDFEGRLGKLKADVEKGAAAGEVEKLRGEVGEVRSKIDAAQKALRSELDSVHTVMREDLDALRKDSGVRDELAGVRADLEALRKDTALSDELAAVRQEVADLKSSVGDAKGLGQRAREAMESVAALEERLKTLQSMGSKAEEAAMQVTAQLERIEMAMRLVEQIDDRVRRVGASLDGGAFEPEFEVEPSPDAELGFELADLLQVMIKHQASDLHLKVGTPPTVRLDGELIPVGNQVLSAEDCRHLVSSAMNRGQRRMLASRKEVDFAYAIPGARFRVNAFMERGNLSAAFRMLRTEMPTIEDLGLPAVLKKLSGLNNGLILVTGPAGSGKSTTLAAMIDYINTHRKSHVITIEDPIEFFHKDKLSIVTQREVGNDTGSFAEALRQALRQDPNVIMVGEMRDPETIMTAVVAAETGHLVFSTLHTPNTVQAVDRIIDTFSGETQRQFRLLLSNSLRGVVSQRLLTRADEKGRVPATEVMVVTPTIASLILEGNTQEIYPYLQQGASDGMQTFTQSLLRLYEAGLISKDEALFHADQPTEFRLGVEGHSTSSASNLAEDTLMNWL